jgi:hypothetical protein
MLFRLLFLFLFVFSFVTPTLAQRGSGRCWWYHPDRYWYKGWEPFFKYWTYRYRLDGWVQKGWVDLSHCYPEQTAWGYCLPPNRILPPKRIDNIRQWEQRGYVLDIGDGGQHLGWYIAVLATEYKLLKDNGLPVDSTITELFYALETLQRLDHLAENVNPYGAPGNVIYTGWCDRNGFLIRQDVACGMLNDPLNPNKFYKGLELSGDCIDYAQDQYYYEQFKNEGPIPTISESTPAITWGTRKGYENGPSIDQISHTLLGLACVVKFIEDGDWYFYEAGTAEPGSPFPTGRRFGYNFHRKAKEIAKNIGTYLKNVNYWITYPVNPNYIIDPNDPFNPHPAHHGHDTKHSMGQHLCHPFRLAIEEIIGESLPAIDPFWELASRVTWNAAKYDLFKIQPQTYNYALLLNLAVIGDSWYWGPGLVNSINVTRTVVNEQSKRYKMEIYPLIYQLFHGGNIIWKGNITGTMNQADCNGPRDFPDDVSNAPLNKWANNHGPCGWTTNNRYVFFDEAARDYKESNPDASGYYNGLDYMLLYNTFNLVYKGELSRYDNFLNNNLREVHLPMMNWRPDLNGYGSHQKPAYFYGFNYVWHSGTISPEGRVQFVANRSKNSYQEWGIKMMDGHHASLGSDVRYRIEDFRCDLHSCDVVNSTTSEKRPCLFGNGSRPRLNGGLNDGLVFVADSLSSSLQDSLFAEQDTNLTDEGIFDTLGVIPPDEVININEVMGFNVDSLANVLQERYSISRAEFDSLISGNANKELINRFFTVVDPFDGFNPFDTTGQNGGNPRMESLRQTNKKPAIAVYPNPFQSGFDIRFTLPEQEKVTITVLNGLGVPVLQVLQDQNYPAGTHELTVDGSTLTAGVYCCKVTVGNNTVQTFNLIKTQ